MCFLFQKWLVRISDVCFLIIRDTQLECFNGALSTMYYVLYLFMHFSVEQILECGDTYYGQHHFDQLLIINRESQKMNLCRIISYWRWLAVEWICNLYWSLWQISCKFTFRPLYLLTDEHTYGKCEINCYKLSYLMDDEGFLPLACMANLAMLFASTKRLGP